MRIVSTSQLPVANPLPSATQQSRGFARTPCRSITQLTPNLHRRRGLSIANPCMAILTVPIQLRLPSVKVIVTFNGIKLSNFRSHGRNHALESFASQKARSATHHLSNKAISDSSVPVPRSLGFKQDWPATQVLFRAYEEVQTLGPVSSLFDAVLMGPDCLSIKLVLLGLSAGKPNLRLLLPGNLKGFLPVLLTAIRRPGEILGASKAVIGDGRLDALNCEAKGLMIRSCHVIKEKLTGQIPLVKQMVNAAVPFESCGLGTAVMVQHTNISDHVALMEPRQQVFAGNGVPIPHENPPGTQRKPRRPKHRQHQSRPPDPTYETKPPGTECVA